jgi:hypothetical protein
LRKLLVVAWHSLETRENCWLSPGTVWKHEKIAGCGLAQFGITRKLLVVAWHSLETRENCWLSPGTVWKHEKIVGCRLAQFGNTRLFRDFRKYVAVSWRSAAKSTGVKAMTLLDQYKDKKSFDM